MNIYVISQNSNQGFDTFDSAVVVAESEGAARLIHPRGDRVWQPGREVWADGFIADTPRGSKWCHPDEVNVAQVGTALEGQRPGVVCASYNAG